MTNKIKRTCNAGLVLLGSLCPAVSVLAAPVYGIVAVGLSDAEHTGTSGERFDSLSGLLDSGQVAGISRRYSNGVESGWSAWKYNDSVTTNIGLTGASFTRNGGYRDSRVNGNGQNQSGQILGSSIRYNGNVSSGQSAWLHTGGVTTEIGLTGAGFVRDDGFRASYGSSLNESGMVRGFSDRFAGATSMGRSTWVYDNATTTEIGLFDVEHTREDGYRFNNGRKLNGAGQVLGEANRFGGGTVDLGQSVWMYNGASTAKIGLIGAEYTSSTGYQKNSIVTLSESGQVSGNADRYDGTAAVTGSSAWFYSSGVTTDITRTSTEFTRNDGYRFSEANQMNQTGQVLGRSSRYNGGATFLGGGNWLYSNGTSVDIGLKGAEHTRDTGEQNSRAYALSESGKVIGDSRRYSGSTYMGDSAWLFDGSNTIDISMKTAEFTRNDGYRDTSVSKLNEAGQVVGTATRYTSSTGGSTGGSAWMYNGTESVVISPTDAAHTSSTSDQRLSLVSDLNEAGQASGIAWRYDSVTGAQSGQSAWFYDATLDQTFTNVFSQTSAGFSYSATGYLGDDGLMLGFYQLFDNADTLLGNRAFSFNLKDGWIDLGLMVADGLDAAGWSYLAAAINANTVGQIIGYGDGNRAYLLTPATVPVPAAIWLFGSGFVALLGFSQKKAKVFRGQSGFH